MNAASDDASTAQPSSEPPSDEPASTSAPLPDDEQRVLIGIRIREAARIYHFSAPRGRVFAGDYVVVDRARGDQLARVVTVADDEDADGANGAAQQLPRDVRPIVRLADGEDRARAAAQAERADQILQEMRSRAVRQELGLYPVAVELNLAGDQGTAWFQAPEHVDFRQMLDEVQEQYHVRLQMQQANQRERASLVDGYDICGLRLCCSSWMTDFPHVGIRVAKDQNLSLNPDSISGVCGRLLCCLTFEHEVYREMRGSLPRVGKRVSTPAGMGKVIKLNVLQQQVTIALDDHAKRVDVPADQIGLAVRTEDAPNQALLEAERDRREDEARAASLRAAAAPAEPVEGADAPESDDQRPPRRKRRRARKSRSAPPEQTNAAPAAETPETAAEAESKRPPRRRRRRKPQAVNQAAEPSARNDHDAPGERADGQAQPPRRRRRRSRRPVNQDAQGNQDNAGSPPS